MQTVAFVAKGTLIATGAILLPLDILFNLSQITATIGATWITLAHIAFVSFMAGAAWVMVEQQRKLREYEEKTPTLRILGPCSRMAEVDTNLLPLWSIIVENTQPGSVARSVRVRMDHPEPQIVMSFPIDLHRMHDNDKPFTKAHDVRYGEPITFDLFACGQLNPDQYYLYRADGDESSQTGPEWMLSSDDNLAISCASRESDGWKFDVIATPDPPASSVRVQFSLKLDNDKPWPSLEPAV